MIRHRRVAPLLQVTNENNRIVSRKPIAPAPSGGAGGPAATGPANGTMPNASHSAPDAPGGGPTSRSARKTSFLNPMQKRLLEATLFGNASRKQPAAAGRAQPSEQVQQSHTDSGTSSSNDAAAGGPGGSNPQTTSPSKTNRANEPERKQKFGLVVDGTTLDLLLKPSGVPVVGDVSQEQEQRPRKSKSNDDDSVSDEGRELFLELTERCESVVCCRASPAQKEIIVNLVSKHSGGRRTLAIGDGSNDVRLLVSRIQFGYVYCTYTTEQIRTYHIHLK